MALIKLHDEKLRRPLHDAPRLGRHVKRLTIEHGFDDWEEEDGDVVFTEVKATLASCPNLTSLKIEATSVYWPTGYIFNAIAQGDWAP